MKRKFLVALFSAVAALCLCFGLAGCGGENEPEAEKGADGHTHTAEHFQVDENGHWKICTECGEKFSVGNHGYNSDNACMTCGYSEVYTKGLNYVLDEDTDTYMVTGLGEATDTTDLIIPTYYEGKAVTVIIDYAFSFYLGNCSGLMSITIPDSVKSIGVGAFEGCTSLTSITIPDSVTSIGSDAFSGTAYYDDASHWDANGVLYIGNYLIKAKNTISGAYIIRQGTKTIADDALKGEYRGSNKYTGCPNLTSITIPDSVTSIGNWAFSYCSGLTSITIPHSVTEIGDGVFAWCNGLESILVASENRIYKSEQNCLIEKQSNTLIVGCKNSVIPDSVTSIGNSAFADCSGLTGELKIPDNVTSIGSSAFYHCNGLTGELKIPDSVTSIGYEAFTYCSGLESVTIGSGVTSIGDGAFDYCSGLTGVYITDLSAWCNIDFSGLWFGDTTNPLYYAHHLYVNQMEVKELVIPNDVTEIKQSAFSGCSGLTSIEIPNSVTSIGNWAFCSCSGLTSITIPDGVTSIGTGAFTLCDKLIDIQFKGTLEEWQAIEKGSDWDHNTGNYTVTCTDGTVAKDGTVTYFNAQ